MNDLINQAKDVLSLNWRKGFTIPTDRLYPFQWNWDSGFISIGLSHTNPLHAMQELDSLFDAQWENGMVPHIIFHDESQDSYFPNHDFWKSSLNTGSPKHKKTSGITQPPVHGFVLEHLWNQHRDNADFAGFLQKIYPKVIALNRFFYEFRDPNREGLCYIYHPWESGRDNSPLWDEALKSIKLEPGDIPNYTRKDTAIADASERPTQRDYDTYVYLCILGQKYQYDGSEIAEESPFLVQDTLMNALLIRSNEGLIRIGQEHGWDVGEIQEWQSQSVSAFKAKLWNESLGCFCSYDLRRDQQIEHKEIGGLLALFAGLATDKQAATLHNYLTDLHNDGYILCPSFDPTSDHFDAKRYWRGPVWPHMNWMVYQGLLRYGYVKTASLVRRDTLDLIANHGFFEYFNPVREDKGKRGLGGNNFSWTASTILDLK